MRRNSLWLLLLATLAAVPGWASESMYDLEFARYLQSRGEYYRAITEYHRVLFLAGPTEQADRKSAQLAIGECYYLGGKYASAADWLMKSRPDIWARPPESGAVDLLYHSLLRSRDVAALFRVNREDNLSDRSDYYQGLGKARMYRWEEAMVLADLVPPGSAWYLDARQLSAVSMDASAERRCDPTAAGVIAVVPGLGYAYTEHWQSAVSALVINGLLMYTTLKSFHNDRDGQGVFWGVVTLAWYSGSIYGSVKSAHRYNRVRDEHAWSQLDP